MSIPGSIAYGTSPGRTVLGLFRNKAANWMIKVLSVDDHALLREGIAALVNAESDMKLAAEATNGQEAIEKFRLHRPDVTLMDLQMPAHERHRGNHRHSKRIPQCPHHCPDDVRRRCPGVAGAESRRAGLHLERHVRRELLDTIRAVHAGQKRIPPEVAAELAEHATEDELSSREIDVLRLIADREREQRNRLSTCHRGGYGQEPRDEHPRQAWR